MAIPRKNLLHEGKNARRKRFPARSIPPEKTIEGNLLTLADVTPAGIGAAETEHGHLQHNLSARLGPRATDDTTIGYSTGSIWVNIATPAIFICVTAEEGAADWNQTDAIAVAADHDHTGGGDGGVLTKPELDDYMILGEIAAPGGDPAANKGWLYVKDDGGTSGLYFEADDGTVTDLLAGGAGTGTLTTIKENNSPVGDADIEILDFLGADFDLTESPNKEIQIVIAAAIARVSALHAETHMDEHEVGGSDEFDGLSILRMAVIYLHGGLVGQNLAVTFDTKNDTVAVFKFRAWNGSSYEDVALARSGASGGAARFELKQGKLTGDLEANSNKITGLAAADANGDAVRYEQLHDEGHGEGQHSETKVLHAIPFVIAAEDATVEIMLPLPGVCIGESGEMGTVTGVRFKVYMGTAGVTGTMTVKLYADSAPNFPSETEIATVDITTEIEDDDTTISSWTPGTDNFLRAKITALHSGTVAKDVACIFYYETTLHA